MYHFGLCTRRRRKSHDRKVNVNFDAVRDSVFTDGGKYDDSYHSLERILLFVVPETFVFATIYVFVDIVARVPDGIKVQVSAKP